MKIEYDHLEGRDSIEQVESLTIIGMGLYTASGQIAEFALVHGSLVLKDMQGRMLGALSVTP